MMTPEHCLPSSLYTQAAVRAAEQALIATGEVSETDLVERAGKAAFMLLTQRLPPTARFVIVAGNGNNGADALVVARLLLTNGYLVRVLSYGERRTDANLIAAQAFADAGGRLDAFAPALLEGADVIVDGLLGTGCRTGLSATLIAVIDAINQASAWVLSLDLPSGVNGDTGNVMPTAIEADATLCLGGLKQGLFTSRARHFSGEVLFADIGLTEALKHQVAAATRVDASFIRGLLGKRPRDSHKGQSGKVTVIGGNYGMAGAVRLCAEACQRTGAGLVTVISRPEHQLTVNATRPELMFWGCEVVDLDVYHRLGSANVLVLGPGLGRDDWAQNLYKAARLTNKACVLDADGLNLLASEPCLRTDCVLTPHPGEAARLLQLTCAEIEADRFAAVRQLQQQYGGVVLLKGAGSLIFDGARLVVAPVGNPGLASGGSGDVLSGIIAGLMAQGLEPMTATVAGVVIHGEAAVLAAAAGERGMLASDLMPFIRQLVNSDLL